MYIPTADYSQKWNARATDIKMENVYTFFVYNSDWVC